MTEETWLLFYDILPDNEVGIIYYVDTNYKINKLYISLNKSNDDLISEEKKSNFLSWFLLEDKKEVSEVNLSNKDMEVIKNSNNPIWLALHLASFEIPKSIKKRIKENRSKIFSI